MSPTPGPPRLARVRPRSNAGFYALVAFFMLFVIAGPVSFVLLRPWETTPPPPPPPPPVDAGVDAGPPDAGPVIPPVIRYRGAVERTSEVTFGGRPYCNYAAFFQQIEVELSTQGTDAAGRPQVIEARVAATYDERAVRRCPHALVPQNRHELALAGVAPEGSQLVVQLARQAGDPPTRATLRGAFGPSGFAGTLELHRNDNFHPLLQFVMTTPVALTIVEPQDQ